MLNKIQYNEICEQGLVRENNQDAVFAAAKGNKGIFCVADGMGGYEKGEVASALIVEKIKNVWQNLIFKGKRESFRSVFNSLSNAIQNANREIYEKYNQGSVCGSTVVVLLVYGRNYGILSAGDSRIYSYHKGVLQQITEDDVWENLPEQKNIPMRELMSSPKYGKLTNAIGTMRDVKINYQTGKLSGSTSFLLCSDGIYKMCGKEDIKRIVSENYKDPKLVTRLLRERVYMSGAKDNLTVIAVDIRVFSLISSEGVISKNENYRHDITDRLYDNNPGIDDNCDKKGSALEGRQKRIFKNGFIGVLITSCIVLLIGVGVVAIVKVRSSTGNTTEKSNESVHEKTDSEAVSGAAISAPIRYSDGRLEFTE